MPLHFLLEILNFILSVYLKFTVDLKTQRTFLTNRYLKDLTHFKKLYLTFLFTFSELIIPDKANVYYAMSTSANYDFVLRQHPKGQRKQLTRSVSLSAGRCSEDKWRSWKSWDFKFVLSFLWFRSFHVPNVYSVCKIYLFNIRSTSLYVWSFWPIYLFHCGLR